MKVSKIILAEDDVDDRTFFGEFLQDRSDISLLEPVEDGEDLLTALEAQKKDNLPDLIILDQNMPRLNGFETLKFLKSHHTYSTIPVVIYSTYATAKLTQDCLGEGAVNVLSKPSDKDGYNKMIDEILKYI